MKKMMTRFLLSTPVWVVFVATLVVGSMAIRIQLEDAEASSINKMTLLEADELLQEFVGKIEPLPASATLAETTCLAYTKAMDSVRVYLVPEEFQGGNTPVLYDGEGQVMSHLLHVDAAKKLFAAKQTLPHGSCGDGPGKFAMNDLDAVQGRLIWIMNQGDVLPEEISCLPEVRTEVARIARLEF